MFVATVSSKMTKCVIVAARTVASATHAAMAAHASWLPVRSVRQGSAPVARTRASLWQRRSSCFAARLWTVAMLQSTATAHKGRALPTAMQPKARRALLVASTVSVTMALVPVRTSLVRQRFPPFRALRCKPVPLVRLSVMRRTTALSYSVNPLTLESSPSRAWIASVRVACPTCTG